MLLAEMSLDVSVVTVMSAILASLTTAIVTLWKTTMRHIERIEDKLDECEKDRERLWENIARLNSER